MITAFAATTARAVSSNNPEPTFRVEGDHGKRSALPRTASFRSLDLQRSQQHLAGVLGGDDLVPFWRESDLEDGTSGYICGRRQPSAVRLNNRAADR